MQATEPTKRFIDRAIEIKERFNAMRAAGDRFPRLDDDEEEIRRKYETLSQMHSQLKKDRGKRYASCTFKNYQCDNDQQREVARQLMEYADDYSNIENGRSVILFGPKGTGKDHLLMALAYRVAGNFGECPMWRNGIDLHNELKRQAFADVPFWRLREMAERSSRILYISDPLPPVGSLSEYQQGQLFGLIDYRYSECKPTWITINVADATEAEQRMGPQSIDRLRHNALALSCYWESHRTKGV